jgi:hypothetical protein
MSRKKFKKTYKAQQNQVSRRFILYKTENNIPSRAPNKSPGQEYDFCIFRQYKSQLLWVIIRIYFVRTKLLSSSNKLKLDSASLANIPVCSLHTSIQLSLLDTQS